MGPVGSAEQAGEKDTPFRTTATLNLQPTGLLTRWTNESQSSGKGLDRGSPAIREDTLFLGPADSPVSHTNLWEWDTLAVTPSTGDTSSSVYDGGGERIPETPPDVNDEKPKNYYMIHVDKLKLCTAATQSQDSVATQPTTH